MKKLIISISIVSLLFAAGCTAQGGGSSIPPQMSSLAQQSSVSSIIEVASEPQSSGEEMPSVADAAIYRGTLTEIDSANKVFTLEQYNGTNFGGKTIKFEITDDTQLDFDKATIAKGQYLEVYYGISADAMNPDTHKAILINNLGEAAVRNLNGKVVSVVPSKDQKDVGDILVTTIGDNIEYQVKYSTQTQMYINIDDLKAGDEINVFYSGISTRSLPPQISAEEIRLFSAVE